jgi:radical SAM protein with 4Fe4S-binding SPASM domain
MKRPTDRGVQGLFAFPRWIVLQLLEACNLRCAMCYEWGKEGAYHQKKGTHQLDLAVIRRVVEDCSPARPTYDFFGGEPLLYRGIDEVISLIKHHGSELIIPTNGTLLEKMAEMLVETGPDKIWVSLDGPERVNDEQRGRDVFKKGVAGIRRILELRNRAGKAHPKIGVTCIVTPRSHLHIEELFLRSLDLSSLDHISIEAQLFTTPDQCRRYGEVLSREFGVSGAADAHARGMVWDESEFRSLDIPEMVRQVRSVVSACRSNDVLVITYPRTTTEENLRAYFSANHTEMVDYQRHCRMPWIHAEITAKGDVAPCHSFYDLVFGNVNDEGILDIWNNEAYGRFRKYMKKNLLPICTACCRYYDYRVG